MTNAAHELADILKGWRLVSRSTTVRASRGFAADTSDDWRSQVRAIGLLSEVDRYLTAAKDAGREVDHYLRAYPNWAKGVIAPDLRWNDSASSTQTVIDQPSLDLLSALGDIMNATQISVSMSEARSGIGTAAIEDLMVALSDPSVTLSEAEKQYVYELVSSVRRVYEESSVFGSVNLLSRVHELLGVMTMLAETLSRDPNTKPIARKIMQAVRRAVPYGSFGAKVTAGTIGVAADLLQITAAP